MLNNRLYNDRQKTDKGTHVVIVTYHMIPYTKIWGASQRMYYLAQHLIEEGFDVSVLHASFGKHELYDKKIDFETIPVEISPKFMQHFQESGQYSNPYISNGAQHRSFKLDLKNIVRIIVRPFIRFIEKIFYNDFTFTGMIVHLWTRSAWPVLADIVRSRQTKTIIFSGPLFTVFRLTRKIRAIYPNINIILDYRDPWNLLRKGSFLTYLKEKKYLDLADKITVFSERFLDDISDHFSIAKDKCLAVYNGYDSDLWNIVTQEMPLGEKNDSKLVISYVSSHITFLKGSYRDIRNLLRAVSSFEYSHEIVLNIVGCIDNPPEDLVSNTSATVNFLPMIPHKDALQIMEGSDVLIVLSSDDKPSRYTLTGKVFDCIRSGAFILGITADQEIDYVQLIGELGVGVGCRNDVKDIQNVLGVILNKWKQGTLREHALSEYEVFSRRHQNLKLISVIRDLCKEKM